MRNSITTPRLILRDIAEADAERLFELDSDPEVMRYVGPKTANDVERYRDRTRTVYVPYQSHPWHGVRIVLDRETGEFLGWVFIRPAILTRDAAEMGWTRPEEVEVGYRYRRIAWGRGIATEAAMPLVQMALDDPMTTAVVACARAENAGSLRVLEKLGLKRVAEVQSPDGTHTTVKLLLMK